MASAAIASMIQIKLPADGSQGEKMIQIMAARGARA